MFRPKTLLTAVVLMLIIILAAGCSSNAAKIEKIDGVEVSIDRALTMWQNKTAIIIDVRTPAEYQEGHIPDVANIPLDQLNTRMAEVPKDKNVLVICRSGKRSSQATTLLRNNGFSNVYNVTEGMNGWKGPVVK